MSTPTAEQTNVHAMETPTPAIDRAALQHNAAIMHEWIAGQDAELWPHAKTSMSPELVTLQLEAGSVGMTAATMQQVRMLCSWGVRRIMLANQLMQTPAARRIAADLSRDVDTEFWSFIDSLEGISLLESAAAEAGVHFDVLIEIGAAGGRSGIRSRAQLESLVAALSEAPHLRLRGVAAYEGSRAGNRSLESLAIVDDYLTSVADCLGDLVALGAIAGEEYVLSAGGSMFFDRIHAAADHLPFRPRFIIRSGCYLLHDHGMFANGTPLPGADGEPGLQPALTVWGTVHSLPEPGLAFLDVGRRDVSYDQGLPIAVGRLARGGTAPEPLHGVRVRSLNDHHTHLVFDPGHPLAIGDRVELGISHPCTTMDKWRRLPVVDSDGTVVGEVTTHF